MNEITRIHLGRQPFTISVDAHKALQEYLHAIEKKVSKTNKEVLEEVELRMAELLFERGVHGDKVVLLADVEYLKEQLGKPGDFSEDGDTETIDEEDPLQGFERPQRRLFRDTKNASIAGVLAGFAAYSNSNVYLLRILFIILTLATSGAGIIIYILLWLAIPEARTPSERLQMQGKPVTIENLRELVDQAGIEQAAYRAGRQFEPFFRTLWSVLLSVLGALFTFAAIAGLIAIGVLGTQIILHHQTLINGVVAFPADTSESIFVISALGLASLIMILLLCTGFSIFRRKWVLPNWATATVGMLMLIAAIVGGSLAVDSIKRVEQRYNASVQQYPLNVASFKNLDVQGDDVAVTYKPSNEYKVEVRYFGANTAVPINATVSGETLKITANDIKKPSCTFACVYVDNDRTVTVYAPRLESVSIMGEGASFTNAEPFRQETLQLRVSPEASADLRGFGISQLKVDAKDIDENLTLTLEGMQNIRSMHKTPLFVSDGRVAIDHADNLALELSRGCELHEPLLQMSRPSDKLFINSELYTMDSLYNGKDNERRMYQNCVEEAYQGY